MTSLKRASKDAQAAAAGLPAHLQRFFFLKKSFYFYWRKKLQIRTHAGREWDQRGTTSPLSFGHYICVAGSPPSQYTCQRRPEPPAGTNTTGKQTDQLNKKTASNDNLDNTSESGDSDTSTETSSPTSNNDEHLDNKHDECSTTDNEGNCFFITILYLLWLMNATM